MGEISCSPKEEVRGRQWPEQWMEMGRVILFQHEMSWQWDRQCQEVAIYHSTLLFAKKRQTVEPG